MRRTPAQVIFQQRVGGALDPGRHVGIGGTAIRGIVFEAAVLGRIVRGRDDDPIGEPAVTVPIIRQDGMRNHRSRRVSVARVEHHIDVVRDQHLQRADQRGLGQGVRVDPDEQRAGDPGAAAGTDKSPGSIARICASLNALSNADPRWPEVPNATRCAATAGSGVRAKYAVTSRGTSTSIDGSTGLPARLLNGLAMAFPFCHGHRCTRDATSGPGEVRPPVRARCDPRSGHDAGTSLGA